MYFIFLTFFVIAVTTVTCNDDGSSSDIDIYDLEAAENHFNEFIEKFDKNYGKEREYRFGVFKENLKKINELNKKESFNLHGITQFADISDEEFMDFAKCFNTDNNINMTGVNLINLDRLPEVTYPAELDYRSKNMVTGVKNQGRCLDCYIFSAVGNVEGLYAKKYSQLQSLSEQEVLDCMSPGCSVGGYPHEAMKRLAGFGGLVKEDFYPYYAQQKSCAVNKNQIVARVQGGNVIQGGESALIQALNLYGPLSVGISVSSSLKHFTGGRVYNDPTCSFTSIDHAVLLVGYGTAPEGPYWLIKNSWGTTWGEEGYVRMARGVNMCRIGGYVATATVG